MKKEFCHNSGKQSLSKLVFRKFKKKNKKRENIFTEIITDYSIIEKNRKWQNNYLLQKVLQ